ncbi:MULTISPECIES: TetR/AcrR family transcriptional regulator [Streptomyces]|uniref:TetR/AcrR family transcriptional regulator n=1 Tax=Streptomyces kasugaensis TaxID=1946 RepID=A0A4Q9HRA8_STRKA|nr:TetR/AcrR family transcriptional regulator [Streptomyces kasugaensis]TBO57039.1 TetR/AcrR family transcriptional regulator [Streptomyces kasugaensis]
MTSPLPRPKGRLARIDQSRTAETALRLLDESGLESLTMRRLADAMGVQAGALYRYFATKQDLLTAMAERMLADIPASAANGPGAAGDWSERLTGLARAMRTALLARRDGARVFAGTHSDGAHTLGFADALTGVLREAGFSDEDAARALMAVISFTVGLTLEEQAVLQPGPANPERLRRAVSPERFPHLAATLPTLASTDFTAHFEFGLRLIIQGLYVLPRDRP